MPAQKNACPESDRRRDERQFSHGFAGADGGQKQAPNGSRHHNARRKRQKATFEILPHLISHEKHARSAENRP